MVGCVRPGAFPDTVWVRVGLGADETAGVVAHECRHLAQDHRDEEDDEIDALDYEMAFRAWWAAAVGDGE
jgi:hypothetical protein